MYRIQVAIVKQNMIFQPGLLQYLQTEERVSSFWINVVPHVSLCLRSDRYQGSAGHAGRDQEEFDWCKMSNNFFNDLIIMYIIWFYSPDCDCVYLPHQAGIENYSAASSCQSRPSQTRSDYGKLFVVLVIIGSVCMVIITSGFIYICWQRRLPATKTTVGKTHTRSHIGA